MASGYTPGHGPSGKVLPTRATGTGSMYGAMQECDRQISQRRYMITEYEDTLENLTKELSESVDKNKALEIQCEKLQFAAESAEANYAMKQREKLLMENGCRELSKKMDEVMEKSAKKRDGLKRVEALLQEKLEKVDMMEEIYMKEYLKNPAIAKRVAVAHQLTDLEDTLKDKKKKLRECQEGFETLKKKKNEEWEAFKKKCVKIAEEKCKTKKKLADLNALRAQCEIKLKKSQLGTPNFRQQFSQSMKPVPFQSSGTSSTNVNLETGGLRSPFKLNVSAQRRSSTFQELDRILCNLNAIGGPLADRRASGSNSLKLLCSPLRTGSSLVSDIKSKLNSTVAVRPTPRNNNEKLDKCPDKNVNPVMVESIQILTNPKKNEANVEKMDISPKSVDGHGPISIEKPLSLQPVKGNTNASMNDDFLLPPPPQPHVKKSVTYIGENLEGNQNKCDTVTPIACSEPQPIEGNMDVVMGGSAIDLGSDSLLLSMDDSAPTKLSQGVLSPGEYESNFFSAFTPNIPMVGGSAASEMSSWSFPGLFTSDNEEENKTTPNFSMFQ